MNIPEEFGKYLLLKKLTEDPLGETFRAGKAGKEGIEQVALLRVFNGKGMDGEKLWQKVSARGAVQQALRSPNIGSGVDMGKVRSFPYAAYDYISGKSLASLLARAAKQLSPIPTDHALLIAERIALALAAGYETRVQEERIQHGFVTPHLVMVSNEGETRLLGFEMAPGLRSLAADGWSAPELRPYLAPETFTGAPLAKSDDVWSLGAILFELLTGENLPALPETTAADGYGPLIDNAELSNEGTPLPPAIVGLLKKSLAPRDQRIPDVVTWHKTLSKLMIDGQFSPTTFNLAFFMHNLFRDEIERESQELQAEKTLDLPKVAAAATAAVAAAPVAAPRPAADMREATAVREGTLPGARPAAPPPAASKTPLYAGIAAVVLLAAAGAGWFFFGRSPAPSQPAAETLAAQSTQPASLPAATPSGPTQEEINSQIQQMVAASSQEMEAKIKQQYDERIKQLQQQLQETKKRDEGGPAATAQIPQTTKTPPPLVSAPEPEPSPAETRTAAKPPEPTPVPASNPSSVLPAADKTVSAPPPQTAPATQTAAPPTAPARPQIQYGDLVTAATAAGVTPPKMTSRLDPRYPQQAKRMNKSAQVDIKVLVDERGRVLDAQRSGAQAGFGFDESALEAARRSVFQPASTRDGVRVKMWTTIRISFQPH
jgi:TonB family protein